MSGGKVVKERKRYCDTESLNLTVLLRSTRAADIAAREIRLY